MKLDPHADPGTIVTFAIDWIRKEVGAMDGAIALGIRLRLAATRFRARYPSATLTIMDHIGSWPSSERELAALQRVYP